MELVTDIPAGASPTTQPPSPEATPFLRQHYFTEEELANEVLHIHRRTLHRWFVQRIGPPRTVIGRLILYRKSSVLEWLAANERRQSNPRRRAR